MFPDERAEFMLDDPRLLASRVCAPPRLLSNPEAPRPPLSNPEPPRPLLMSRLAALFMPPSRPELIERLAALSLPPPGTSRDDTSPRWIDCWPASARPRN